VIKVKDYHKCKEMEKKRGIEGVYVDSGKLFLISQIGSWDWGKSQECWYCKEKLEVDDEN
jgi:hypothetical protein